MNPQQQAAQQSVLSAPPTPGVASPNLLERLLPTIGGIGGGLLGTLADPFTAGLGTVAGGAAGSAAGQQLENNLTGGDQSTLGAAVEGGIGQGLGKGLQVLGKAGAGALATKGANQAAEATAGNLAKEWGLVPKGIRENQNLNSTADTFGRYGVDFTPENAASVSGQVTGPEGAVVSDLVRSAMEKNPVNIDTTGTRALVNNIANSPELATAGPTVGKQFAKALNGILGGTEDAGAVNNIPAADIYQARQQLQSLAYKKGVSPALSSAYRDVMNSLDDSLTRSGVDQVAAKEGLSADQLKTLENISPQLAQDVQEASQNSIGALRSVQRPFVNASNLAAAHANAAEGVVGDTSGGATTAPGASGGLLGRLLGGRNTASKLEGLGGAGEMLMGHPAVGVPMMGASALTRYIQNNPLSASRVLDRLTGAANGIIPTATAQVAAHLPTSGAPDVTGAGGGQPMDNSYQTQGPSVGPSQAWAALFAPQLVPGLQKAAAAQPALNSLEQAYGNAGGGQGAGGILAALSALIPGTAAYQYNQAKTQAGAQLSQATGSPLEAIMAALPGLMGSQQGANNAFGGLQGQVSNLANINPQAGSVLAGIQ